MVFYHKYFLYVKCFKDDFEKYLACTTCIFLANKVCNQLVPMKYLCDLFLKMYVKNTKFNFSITEEHIYEVCEKLCMKESEIINCLGFDMDVDLPYRYVQSMKPYFLNYLKNPKLMIITTNFINDSFKLPLCLYFDPILIALASMYLLSVYFKIHLVDKEGIKWYNIIDKSIQLEDIILISEKINAVYKFCNEHKNKNMNDYSKPSIKFNFLNEENVPLDKCKVENILDKNIIFNLKQNFNSVQINKTINDTIKDSFLEIC